MLYCIIKSSGADLASTEGHLQTTLQADTTRRNRVLISANTLTSKLKSAVTVVADMFRAPAFAAAVA